MAGTGVGAHRLIGRDRELATLGSFLDEAVGDGATLLLTGEPGVSDAMPRPCVLQRSPQNEESAPNDEPRRPMAAALE
jgi:hypothetical protein